jgi:N-acetylmuramoyl-L-alanine amidase
MSGLARVILLIMFILNISINPINEVVVEPVAKIKVAPVYIQHISPIDNIKYVTEDIIVEEPLMAQEDIDLIALVTMAEAEGECEEGKRLVIDTILNRVDSTYFPDTVHGVIYQKNAFSSMWNGRVDRCSVKDDIVILVEEELRNRLNHDVVFFTAGKYGKYGTPLFQVGNHYFASYE